MSSVKCPKCMTSIRVSEKTYGRKVQCKCGCIMRMPAAPTNAPAAHVDLGANALAPIKFQCPSCAKQLQVKGEYAGKVSQCKCGAKIRVPAGPPATAPADNFAADPFGNEDPFANSDPFANAGQEGDFMSATSGAVPNVAPKYRKPVTSQAKRKVVKKQVEPERSSHGGGIAIDGEIIGGVACMIGAVVWFVAGLFAGYIFFYPPVLFVLGLIGVIKGIFSD